MCAVHTENKSLSNVCDSTRNIGNITLFALQILFLNVGNHHIIFLSSPRASYFNFIGEKSRYSCMCGIFAILGCSQLEARAIKQVTDYIDKRGPDYQSELKEHVSSCGLKLTFKAAVLHLKGHQMQRQPISDEAGDTLMFNGLVYKYCDRTQDESISDTCSLFMNLKSCESAGQIAQVVSQIDGPFTFIFWSERLKSLVFGRDVFGRKSLCSFQDSEGGCPFILSSSAFQWTSLMKETPHSANWAEVNCDGIHCWQFLNYEKPKYTCYYWDIDRIYKRTDKCKKIQPTTTEPLLRINILKPLSYELVELPGIVSDVVDAFETRVLQAISIRAENQRLDCLDCRASENKHQVSSHSKYSLAFSGGIDSVILAVGLHKVLDINQTVDLVNVAFKAESPDRLSAGKAFQEIISICPGRNWNLVLCDVSTDDLQKNRENCIRHLIHPCNTVVDDSLGCALWFIGRAQGRRMSSNELHSKAALDSFLDFDCKRDSFSYRSPACLMFVGSGIDEQLGGYSSHRAAWLSGGQKRLVEEVSFQMRRLSSRNLGRDDRVLSYHGREVKLPFLDSGLVSFLNKLPVDSKMNFTESPDRGQKKLLRLLANRWGLEESASRLKRAMQFGSRIANLENRNENGNDTCSRLQSQGDPAELP